ncbi:hypothetical protein I553_5625 [Mycobacterium xenopi 4042]|uniref:Uncharacterized protein n=1 Tax=Mycobacterium xenopi 4042 TaxID=1299334 RepID=X7ZX36_MYCXE|nr:hypothetical protein I553_5625 [Mycobacterium xenopi 4042]
MEGDVHARGSTVDESHPIGHATLPKVTNHDRADTVVTAQQIATADDQHRATRKPASVSDPPGCAACLEDADVMITPFR